MSKQAECTYDVFISYSHTDQEWVKNWLLPRLEAANLRVCIDYRDFDVGVPSLVNIERAVDDSRRTLLILTPAWVESAWTEFESLLTQTTDPAGRQRRLLPLVLQTCQRPRRIAMLTSADFTRPDEREAQLSRVVAAIRGELRLQEVGPSLQQLPVPVKPGITEQTMQIHKEKEALSPKTVESEIPFATVPPLVLFVEQARREWRERIDDGFEPIPFEQPNADRPYGHADAPIGNVILGKGRIPFSLPPHQNGNGHRIIEVHPQHASDQVAKDIRPAEVNDVVALYVLLSAGDTRRMRGEQRFDGKEIGRLQIHFCDGKTPMVVPLRLGIEIREWVSGDMMWNVVTKATGAEEVWYSPDRRYTIDMIRIDMEDAPRDVSLLTVVGECKWLPSDYRDALPSVRISGVTYKVDNDRTGQVSV